jgi:Leucine-rich repeat (LRR) protein
MNILKILWLIIFVFIIQCTSSQNNIETHIPDLAFKTYCLENFDTDHDGWLSQAERDSVKTIDLRNADESRSIYDITGLELFTGLKYLDCSDASLYQLNISKNTALVYLDCSDNLLSKLDVSNNTNLDTLYCGHNRLKELDITHNTKLVDLDCSENQISVLSLKNNKLLTDLDCSGNKLENLDLKPCTNIEYLVCSWNLLKELDVSFLNNLYFLRCYRNELNGLDVSQNTKLKKLDCSHNNINMLNLDNNPGLIILDCYDNKLNMLSIRNCPKITEINCCQNKLRNLDLSNQNELKKLMCNNNHLNQLHLPHTKTLNTINCAFNQLDSLDIGNNAQLEKLDCSNNQLKALDFSKNGYLSNINYFNNPNLTNVILNDYQKRNETILGTVQADFGRLDAQTLYHLVPFRENQEWGMMDSRNKKIIIEPHYKSLNLFSPSAYGEIRNYSQDMIRPYWVYFKITPDSTGKIKVTDGFINDKRILLTGATRSDFEIISFETGYKGFSVDETGKLKSISDLYNWSVTPFLYKGNYYAKVAKRDYSTAIIDTSGNALSGFGFDYTNISLKKYKDNYYAIVANKANKTAVKDLHGNTLPGLGFDNVEIVPNINPTDEKWFYVKDIDGNCYLKSLDGKTKSLGKVTSRNNYNLFGYDIFKYGKDTTAIFDYAKMKFVFSPQEKLKFESIRYASQTEIDTKHIRNRKKAKIYIWVIDSDNEYYINLKGKKYLPKKRVKQEEVQPFVRCTTESIQSFTAKII